MAENEQPINGSRFRVPAMKWSTLVFCMILVVLVGQTWLVWRNIEEWGMARTAQAGISKRVADDRDTMKTNNERMFNELKLQTFNNALPTDEQRQMLVTLYWRLDEDTRKQISGLGLLSLKLRGLNVIGEQQSQGLQPQRPHRGLAP
ncbi:MAG TPA: hypothetical protein VJL08_02610 [Dehalococcoidia bacterium]|nr:hypothetical protein [Dehalococcoidia bacterium]